MASRHHIERVGAHPAANPAFERRPYAAVEIGPLGRHVRIVRDLVVGQIAHPPVGVGDLMSPVVGGAYAAGHLLARRQRGIIAPVPFARDALGVTAVERIGGPQREPLRLVVAHCVIAGVIAFGSPGHVGDDVADFRKRFVRCGQFGPGHSQRRSSCSRGRVRGRIVSSPARSSFVDYNILEVYGIYRGFYIYFNSSE